MLYYNNDYDDDGDDDDDDDDGDDNDVNRLSNNPRDREFDTRGGIAIAVL